MVGFIKRSLWIVDLASSIDLFLYILYIYIFILEYEGFEMHEISCMVF